MAGLLLSLLAPAVLGLSPLPWRHLVLLPCCALGSSPPSRWGRLLRGGLVVGHAPLLRPWRPLVPVACCLVVVGNTGCQLASVAGLSALRSAAAICVLWSPRVPAAAGSRSGLPWRRCLSPPCLELRCSSPPCSAVGGCVWLACWPWLPLGTLSPRLALVAVARLHRAGARVGCCLQSLALPLGAMGRSPLGSVAAAAVLAAAVVLALPSLASALGHLPLGATGPLPDRTVRETSPTRVLSLQLLHCSWPWGRFPHYWSWLPPLLQLGVAAAGAVGAGAFSPQISSSIVPSWHPATLPENPGGASWPLARDAFRWWRCGGLVVTVVPG